MVAERMRSQVDVLIVPYHGEAVRVHASLGVASSEGCGLSWQNLMEQSDAALYRAKRGGRNRVVTAEAWERVGRFWVEAGLRWSLQCSDLVRLAGPRRSVLRCEPLPLRDGLRRRRGCCGGRRCWPDYLMVPLRPAGKKTPLLVALPPVTIWMIWAGVRAKAMLLESASTKVVAGSDCRAVEADVDGCEADVVDRRAGGIGQLGCASPRSSASDRRASLNRHRAD